MKPSRLLVPVIAATILIFGGLAIGCQVANAQTTQEWCGKWEKRMYNAWDRMTDADQCFYANEQSYWLEYDVAEEGATDAEYMELGRLYRKTYYTFQKKFKRLKYRMTHPKGPLCGNVWKPLIRWTWPGHDEWTVATVARIIQRESNGQPNCITGSFRGLMQIYNGDLSPMANLKQAHRWFNDAIRQGGTGWEPWRATAY
jgi:hypothetical protein